MGVTAHTLQFINGLNTRMADLNLTKAAWQYLRLACEDSTLAAACHKKDVCFLVPMNWQYQSKSVPMCVHFGDIYMLVAKHHLPSPHKAFRELMMPQPTARAVTPATQCGCLPGLMSLRLGLQL